MWKFFQKIFGTENDNQNNQTENRTVSAGGYTIVSPHGSFRQTQRNFFDSNALMKALSVDTVLFSCGHEGPSKAEFVLWGRVLLPTSKQSIRQEGVQKVVDGRCNFCVLEWLQKVSARCALCGCGIIPGDMVALYDPDSPGIHRDVAKLIGDRVLGCMSPQCCPSDGYFGGRWTLQGLMPAFQGRARYEHLLSIT